MKTILQLKKLVIIPLLFLVGNVCVGQNTVNVNIDNLYQFSVPTCPVGSQNRFCGPTAMEMVLAKLENRSVSATNITVFDNLIENHTGTSNLSCGTGTADPRKLVWLAKQYGFDADWYGDSVIQNSYPANNSLDFEAASGNLSINDLVNFLNNGIPVIVQVNTGMNLAEGTHWMVLREINTTNNYVKLNDPGKCAGFFSCCSGNMNNCDGYNRQFTLSQFLNCWQSTSSGDSRKRCLIVKPNLQPNQSLSIYGGTVANPKEINVYFKATDFNTTVSASSSFTVPSFNIKNPVTNALITVPSNYISQLPSTTVGGIVWRHFKVDLSFVANNSNLPTNGYACDIGFDVEAGSTTKHFHGDNQLYFLDPSTLTDIGTLDDKWYDKYVKDGVNYGLFRGGSPSNTTSSVSFNPSGLLTKPQAAAVVVTAGVKLGILNIDTSGTPYADIPPSNPYFRYVQTLKNAGITGTPSNNEFGVNENITQDRFCKWVAMACNITAADINQLQYINTAVNINYTSTDATLQPYVNIMTKTPSIRSGFTGNAVPFIEPLYSPFDYSTVTTSTMPASYVCSKNVTRDIMAKVMTLAYEYKKPTSPNAQGRSVNNTNSIPSDFIAYGEKYDNASITATSTPITPTQQTYSCTSGGSITIFYNPGSFPQHYYWSMLKNGATLTSNNSAHSSVTFTAPTVSTPTQWKLYTYTANNKGKARETFITINVGGTVNTTIPTPTNLQLTAYTQSSIYIEWETVGFGITNYEVQYSQDPNFTYGTVNNIVNSNFLTGNWEPTGLSGGIYYVRVRSVNATGGTSAWTQTSSITLNSNTQPIIANPTPTAGTTISGNSVTLNFQATNGNAPLTYTVYFSTWNPQGNTPVATNIATPSFTVNNLTPNNTYFWAVKVVDADGDEFITNNYSLNTSPSTTVPNGTIAIENGATTINSISVNLNVTATAFNGGTITGMRFSNDGITWTDSWEQYNLNRPAWSLVGNGGTSTPGVKTVYVQFRDNSGNISPTYSDSITLSSGAKGAFIVRDRTFESLRAANEYAIYGDIIYATAGYFDLTSEKGSFSYLPYSTSIGGGLKDGVSLIGEGADKTTLFWDGTQTRGLGLAGNNTIQGITFIVSLNQNVSRATILLHGASNITIKNCIFKNGDYSVESYNFYGNTTANSNINIFNNLFINNNSRALYFINCNSLNVYNNTFNNNGFQTISLSNLTNLNFKNNIISNNKAEAIAISTYSNLDFKNNNVFNNRFSATSPVENYVNFTGHLSNQTGINSNISVDPLFVNSALNNFNLNSASPCVNTGTNVSLPFFGAAPEIGAFELGGSGSIVLNSNVTSSFLVTRPNGTQQTYNNGQTISNLSQGIYGIYPQAKVGYYPPNDIFVYLNINETKNFVGNYTLDTQGPEAKIYINGDVYSTHSPYVTIFCDVVDKINGLQNGQMQFSNNGINWTSPEPIKNKKLLWDLSNGNIANLTAGPKTVYAKFSDKNGFWSNIITDIIEYIPTGKIKLVEPNNNVSNLDFRNTILNAQTGDILLLKEGIYSIFGGNIIFPTGITFQGINKLNSKIFQLSAIDSKDGFKFDNLTLNAVTTQNFYTQDIPNSKNSIFSNNVFINESITNNGNNLIVANNIFKNISTNNFGFLMYYSNDADSKFKVANNVFDASVNNPSLQTENGISINGMCCGNLFEINNNNFINFDILTTGAFNGGAIKYSNSSTTIGDILIKNNNFFNCLSKITKFNGSDISKDKFTYSYNPNLNTDYSLPANSPLANSGNTDLVYNDHNGSTNDIGNAGGIYYNTPPTVSVTSEETGFNQFKFTANATDAQTPVNSIQYRWDFNNDGIMDTPFLLSNEISRTITTATTDMIVCYVFDELFAIGYQIIPTPTASNISLSITQPQTTAICSGSSSSFQTIATGNFNQGNEFKVIYSGPNGDFSNPQFTQNLISQPNGLLNITFPANLPTCTTCYVKLVSTNPANSSNTTLAAVYQAPQASISITPATTTICPNTNLTFTATPTNGGTTPTYSWKKNGVVVGSNSVTYNATGLNNGDIVWAEMVSNQACGSTTPVIATPTTINVTQIDELFIQAIDNILAASTDTGIQWIRNGQAIAGATSQFYEATQTGFYQFSVTVGSCVVLSPVYHLTTLSTSINNFDNNTLKVYPNPFKDFLTIQVKEDNLQTLQLIDLNGRIIKTEKVSGESHQFYLENLPQAVYILEIKTDKRTQKVKVVKK